jgi:nucleotide-binding universal stress UspA family protein
MQWTTMLVPLDGSTPAEIALPFAEVIARATGAEIYLLAVVERRPRGLTGRSAKFAAQREEEQHERFRNYLAETAEVLRGRGLTVRTDVAAGAPAETILATADQAPGSVIVMSTHGRSGVDRVDRWSIGGVADKVMRLSTRPTLLTRLPYTRVGYQPSRRMAELAHLVVPLDGSPLAENAVNPAMELARAAGARLTLLRVEPWLTEGSAPYGAVREFTLLEDEAASAAEDYLAGVRRQLPDDLNVEPVVLRGRAAESLIEFCLHERIDLVVMTTHGRGGFRRMVIGSTADRLVRSGIPTLLVRLHAQAEQKPSAGEQAGTVPGHDDAVDSDD